MALKDHMRYRPQLIAFDIIDTCFQIEALGPALEPIGLPSGDVRRLYAETLRDATALACAGRFAPFVEVMSGALAVLLSETDRSATESARSEALAAMRTLPPHPDLAEALAVLASAGMRMIALSNGAAAATQSLLDRAGVAHRFEAVLSVDSVRFAKPRPEVYRYALEQTAVPAAAAMLVACHPWDIQGAQACGLTGGYVRRGKPFPKPLGGPDLVGETLVDVARQIVAMQPSG